MTRYGYEYFDPKAAGAEEIPEIPGPEEGMLALQYTVGQISAMALIVGPKFIADLERQNPACLRQIANGGALRPLKTTCLHLLLAYNEDPEALKESNPTKELAKYLTRPSCGHEPMVVALFQANGVSLMVLVLSPELVTQLKDGRPLLLSSPRDYPEIDFPRGLELLICVEEDVELVEAMLKQEPSQCIEWLQRGDGNN